MLKLIDYKISLIVSAIAGFVFSVSTVMAQPEEATGFLGMRTGWAVKSGALVAKLKENTSTSLLVDQISNTGAIINQRDPGSFFFADQSTVSAQVVEVICQASAAPASELLIHKIESASFASHLEPGGAGLENPVVPENPEPLEPTPAPEDVIDPEGLYSFAALSATGDTFISAIKLFDNPSLLPEPGPELYDYLRSRDLITDSNFYSLAGYFTIARFAGGGGAGNEIVLQQSDVDELSRICALYKSGAAVNESMFAGNFAKGVVYGLQTAPPATPTAFPTATPSIGITASATETPDGRPTPDSDLTLVCYEGQTVELPPFLLQRYLDEYGAILGACGFPVTATPTLASTATNTPVPVASLTPSPTLTATSTATSTLTPTAPATNTVTPSATPTYTLTAAPSWTATATRTATATNTATATATATQTATFTPTPSVTRTATPTHTLTATPSWTATATRTATATNTATATATATQTATYTPTATVTRTATSSATPTHTKTAIPSWTATATRTATATNTATATVTLTPTFTATSTATATLTPVPPTVIPVSLPCFKNNLSIKFQINSAALGSYLDNFLETDKCGSYWCTSIRTSVLPPLDCIRVNNLDPALKGVVVELLKKKQEFMCSQVTGLPWSQGGLLESWNLSRLRPSGAPWRARTEAASRKLAKTRYQAAAKKRFSQIALKFPKCWSNYKAIFSLGLNPEAAFWQYKCAYPNCPDYRQVAGPAAP